MSSNESEKILIEVDGVVKFKKNDGKLKLSTNRLIWTPKESGGKKFQCQYSDIKGKKKDLDTTVRY